MNQLSEYLSKERGLASRVAETVGISRGYLSDVANGKKTPSVKVWREIAQATGLPLSSLMGEKGFAEGLVEPYDPGPRANEMKALIASIAPKARHPQTYICAAGNRDLGIRAGDIIIIDLAYQPERLRDGDEVICQVVTDEDAGTGVTLLGTVARPWLIGSGSELLGKLGQTVSVMGVIHGLLRGDGIN